MLSATGESTFSTSDNEALIESSFRRLLAAIEAEREKHRSDWQRIQDESNATASELERLRQETEEWCSVERNKIQDQWNRLNRLTKQMNVQPKSSVHEGDYLHINCSGQKYELPKSALANIEGSHLNHMFSDKFIKHIPRDKEGNFFLDFNPVCFDIIFNYLLRLTTNKSAPPPEVPPERQQSMDLLVEALHLEPFMRANAIRTSHETSLRVIDKHVTATHEGWQVISAERPLLMSGPSYFEVTVLKNPDPKRGGLAIGVCGHEPKGTEVHSIRIDGSVFYSSGNGLVSSEVALENVHKGVQLVEGSVLGVRHDINTRTLYWYHNRVSIGACSIKADSLEKMHVLYPVFAMFTPEQKLQVDFGAAVPKGGAAPRT